MIVIITSSSTHDLSSRLLFLSRSERTGKGGLTMNGISVMSLVGKHGIQSLSQSLFKYNLPV